MADFLSPSSCQFNLLKARTKKKWKKESTGTKRIAHEHKIALSEAKLPNHAAF